MYNGVRMKAANPFPSVSLLLPEDVLENHDDRVSSYWRKGDTCLLQLSSFTRQSGAQVSATQRLSDRTKAEARWKRSICLENLKDAKQPPQPWLTRKELLGFMCTWFGRG